MHGTGEPWTGKEISKYRILGALGAGGMGVVFRAEDTKLGRSVALKFLPSNIQVGVSQKERFLLEAKAASALDHVNIGTIYGIEETGDGQMFIVMAYYAGETLTQKIQRGPLPPAQAIEISIQVLTGLADAHAKGIIHRDIKPSNIIVTEQGVVKIVDFGLAKIAGAGQLTQTGATLGTAGYMSPEQALGRPVDHRGDLWSVGIVLYEMLMGRSPFVADSFAGLLFSVVNNPPQPMDGIPEYLQHIVLKALAKDPDFRYQSAFEMLADLKPLAGRNDSKTQSFAPDVTTLIQQRASQSLMKPVIPSAPRIFEPFYSKPWFLIFAALLCLIIVTMVPAVRSFTGRAGGNERHIVVLPFNNIGKDAANQEVCDGLIETLSSSLSELEAEGKSLWVVPASEVRRRKIADPSEAARQFGVNMAVTGSVQRNGRAVRLTVNLIDTKDLRQLGSAVVDDSMGDFSTLQDSVVLKLARLLAVQNPKGKGQVRSSDPVAYEDYLKAIGYLQRWDRPGNLDKSITLLTGVVQRDPKFAVAFANLGEAYRLKNGLDKNPKWTEEALRYCREAAGLNATLPATFVTLGRIHDAAGQQDLALQEFQKALDLEPRNPDALQGMARTYESLGRIKEAEEIFRKATILRPDYWDGYNKLGAFYFRQRRLPEAEVQYRRVLEITPDNGAAYSNLGVVLKQQEKAEEATAMYRKAIELNPTYSSYNNLANMLFNQQNFAGAAAMYEKALQLNDKDYQLWGNLANAYHCVPGQEVKASSMNQKAIQLAEQLARTSTSDEVLQSNLSLYYSRLGDKQRAEMRMQSALALSPEDRNVLGAAGEVYENLGERKKAVALLTKALKLGLPPADLKRNPALKKLIQDRSLAPLL